MGRTLSRRLWLTMASMVTATTVVVGWQSGVIRQWASYGRMALFRVSLASAITRDGAAWSVQRSAVLGGTLWLFDLRREGSRAPDSASLFMRFYPSSDVAGEQFVRHGNEFIAPVATIRYQRTPQLPVHFDLAIISHATLPSLGESNFVWDGYGSNTRGVIKFQQGRVIAQINAPSLSEAEQLGWKVAALLAER